MRASFGGGAQDFTDAALDRLQNVYKCVEGQLVEQDLAPHKEIADRLHARGMKAIYNVEAIWINSGFNVNADISGYRGQLQAIKNAGWDAAISEGLSEKQVSVLREYLPYYNEGGEQGENVYSGGMYYRPTTMADGNYLECYHLGVNYDTAFSSANQSTPDNMGMTFMLYLTASLEIDYGSLIRYIDSLLNRGIKIKTMTFWVGFGQSALNKLDNDFYFLWNALNNKYNFSTTEKPIVGGNEMVYLFVRGTDDGLWHQQSSDNGVTWSQWSSLGGVITSAPQQTTENGITYVYARGKDNALWYRSVKGGNWADRKGRGGQLKENGDLTIVDGKPA